jgi:hypothetical protein
MFMTVMPGNRSADDGQADDAIARVIDSAARLGVELDQDEATKWIESMAAEATGGDIVVDVASGVFGHRATMLDLQPQDLDRFRKIAASRTGPT